MSSLSQDLRYALRLFSNSPGSTTVAILVLGLGIGANAAIFSVTNAVLFRSLPYKTPERVVFVWGNKLSKGMREQMLSPADYKDYQTRTQSFDQLGAIRSQSSVLTGGEVPERIETAAVSATVFDILGLRPALGRSFAPGEDQPGHNSVAIVSSGFWERHFARQSSALGKTLELDGSPYTIVGVAPPGFVLPDSKSDLWIPYTPDPADFLPTNRALRFLTVLGHLRAGVTREQAQSELRIVADQLAQEYPDKNAGFSVDLVPLREQLVGDLRPTLWMLMAAVGVVLLIACVNAAHLLLVQAGAREKEIAVRTAMGANPGRLIRQVLTESVLLALVAGVLGLVLAYWGTALLTKFAPGGLEQAGNIAPDWHVLAFTLSVSIVTGLVFGLAPALSISRSNLNSVLRSGGRGATGNRTQGRFRDVLMACEVASSAVLLIGAGLLIRSFIHLQDVNPGFRPDHVLTMELSLPQARYPGLKVGLFYQELLDRIARLPGVQSAGICRFLPLSGNDASGNFQIEGQPPLASADQPRAKFRTASGGYFSALGIPLIRGRLFDNRDNQNTPKVVVINETAARRYWPHDDPVGKRILSGFDRDQWSTIIGVVGDIKHTALDVATQPETYYHYLQIPPGTMNFAESTMSLALRTAADPDAMAASVRQELRNIDPSEPVFEVRAMQQVIDSSIAQPRFRTFLVSIFAALALALASLGLYGVIAYSVSQRTTELGIRMALGAEPGSILRLVVFHATTLAVIGLASGVAIILAVGHVISRFLFGINPADPITLGVSCLVILLIAVIASWVPARRAAKVDPAIALRAE